MRYQAKTLYWLIFGALCVASVHAQSSELAGIAHVAFRVSDLAESRAFYRRLGFDQAFEFTDGGRTSVAFIKINDHQFIELYPRSEDTQSTGLMHICFEANDIESVHSAYVRRALQPAEIKKARAGNLLFIMHDLEGQLLEYTQYMPDSLHSQDRGKHMPGNRLSNHLLEATLPVNVIATEREFYVTKLGFRGIGSAQREFRIADNSSDRVALQPRTQRARPEIVFRVSNVRETAQELLNRGFKTQASRRAVSVVDRDGTIFKFVPHARAARK